MIREVPAGSAADQAGLRGTSFDSDGRLRQLGDLIVKVDGQDTPGYYALLDVLDGYQLGKEVSVVFVRDDRA